MNDLSGIKAINSYANSEKQRKLAIATNRGALVKSLPKVGSGNEEIKPRCTSGACSRKSK